MIDEYIQAVMTKKQIPGLSVAVVRSCPETTSDFSHLKQGKLWEQRKQGERRNTEFNNGQVLSCVVGIDRRDTIAVNWEKPGF